MKLVNLTPHPIHILSISGFRYELPGSPVPARCEQHAELLYEFHWHTVPNQPQSATYAILPVYMTRFGEATNLPEPEEDTLYIVSRLLLEACPERHDLVCPADMVRDSAGHILGCRGFSR